MNRLKLITGVTLIFLVGALAGSLVTGLYLRKSIKDPSVERPCGPHDRRKSMIMERLTSRLDLTESQVKEVSRIVEEFDTKVTAIRLQYFPEIRKILDRSFEQIRERLTPGQQKKLDELRRKIEARRAQDFMHLILNGKRPDQILVKLKSRLNLTDDQIGRIRPVMEENYQSLNTLVQKIQGKDRPEIFSMKLDVRELEKKTQKALAGILTKEQMETYLEILREERLERPREEEKQRLKRD